MPQPLPPASLLYPPCFISSPQRGAALGRCPWPGARDGPAGTAGRSSRQGSALHHPVLIPLSPALPDICSSPIALEEGRMLLPLWPAVGLPPCPQRDVPGQAGSLAQLSDVPAPGQWDCRSCKAGDDREASRTECFWGTRGDEAGQPHPRASWHRTALQPCSQPRACLDRASVLACSIPKASGPGPSVQFGGMAALPSLLPAALCFYFFFSL